MTARFKWFEVGAMEALAHLRSLFGSQKALADAMRVSVSTVSMWRISFPAERRLQAVEVCRERGLPVDAELVLGARVVSAVQPQLEAA